MTGDAFDRLRRAAADAFAGSDVRFAYLFGSVARGRARRGSDVDVAVRLGGAPDPVAAADLALDLAARLADASGVPGIEVLVLNDAPLPVRGRAVRDGRVFFSREEADRVAYESLTLRELFDHEIHARTLDAELLRRTANGLR